LIFIQSKNFVVSCHHEIQLSIVFVPGASDGLRVSFSVFPFLSF